MNEIAFSGYEGDGKGQPQNLLANSAGKASDQSKSVAMPQTRSTRDFEFSTAGRNKLLETAMPLLGLAIRVRDMSTFSDIEALHARLSNEVDVFQSEIEALNYDEATVLAARYVICAAIDEAVLSNSWGAESFWPERPLLSVFHNETWGGEKVFAVLDRVMDEAHRFVDLLELIYYILAVGFEGKYHVMYNGQVRLETLLTSVHGLLEKYRGAAPDRIVTPEVNVFEKGNGIRRQFPVWGIFAIAAIVLIATFFVFDINLTTKIQDIGQSIESVLSLGNVATEVDN